MKPGPAAAADWVIRRLPLDHPPTDPEDLIVRIAVDEAWFSSLEEAQEAAESWRARFINRLTLHINDPERRSRPTRFEFNSSSQDAIQGSCFAEDSDSDELKLSKAARSCADDYRALIKSLTGREFEGVCRGLLELMGCEDPVVTPKGNDQGIDFHGRLELAGRLNKTYAQPSVDRAMRTWIVGQAKQIDGVVGTGEVRDLIGSIELAKRGVSADDGRALKELSIKPFESSIGLFVTTGEVSRDAWKLINRAGLVCMDGEMVAVLLADHSVADNNGVVDSALFTAWVEGQLPGTG